MRLNTIEMKYITTKAYHAKIKTNLIRNTVFYSVRLCTLKHSCRFIAPHSHAHTFLSDKDHQEHDRCHAKYQHNNFVFTPEQK